LNHKVANKIGNAHNILLESKKKEAHYTFDVMCRLQITAFLPFGKKESCKYFNGNTALVATVSMWQQSYS